MEVLDTDGFKNDVLGRKSYGEMLRNIIINSEDELVICLDGEWGSGKTTFVKMLRGLLKQSDVHSIYIDAFRSDHVKDPFFAVASEISSFANTHGIKTAGKHNLKDATIAVGVQLLSSGIDAVLKIATSGLVSASGISDIKDAMSNAVKADVEKRLEEYSNSMAVFDAYRASLAAIPPAIAGNKNDQTATTDNANNKLVVIVDELDRCKPTFAISLLEQVKHLFSVPNVVFVLVMNKEQLQRSICSVYGAGVDASMYLQKFINLETRIPRNSSYHEHQGDISKYIRHLWQAHDFVIDNQKQKISVCLEVWAKHFELSLRQLERVFTNIAILHGGVKNGLQIESLGSFLAVLKVVDGDLFNKILSTQINYDALVKKIHLSDSVIQKYNKMSSEYTYNLEFTLDWLRFSLFTDEEYKSWPQKDPERVRSFWGMLEHYRLMQRSHLIEIIAQHLNSFIAR